MLYVPSLKSLIFIIYISALSCLTFISMSRIISLARNVLVCFGVFFFPHFKGCNFLPPITGLQLGQVVISTHHARPVWPN